MPWPVWAICTLFLVCGVFGLVWEHWPDVSHKDDIAVVKLPDGQNVRLDSRDLGTGQLHLFEATSSGHKVKFIVERTPDKVVHVALASCRACYLNRNSHYTHKGMMICGTCKETMDFETKGRQARTDHCALVEVPHSESDSAVAVLARDALAQTSQLPQ